MPSSPLHFDPEISTYTSIPKDGWEARRLTISSHLGTHLDAPKHFILGAADVREVDLEILIGRYQVLRFDDVVGGTTLTAQDLPDNLATRVLIATGWSETHLDSPEYFDNPPVLDESAARKLVDAGTRIVGLDGPTVDMDGEVHRILLGAGVVIIESLTKLTLLGSQADVIVLPLPILGGDGSPVRAVGRPAAVVG